MNDIKFDIPVELLCPQCKQKSLVTDDEGPEPKDGSLVYCKSCGAKVGLWSEVREAVLKSKAEQIRKKLEDMGPLF
jgi:uncharacterized protein YbaR (Trm112 family)